MALPVFTILLGLALRLPFFDDIGAGRYIEALVMTR
jgi:hypothetical protein